MPVQLGSGVLNVLDELPAYLDTDHDFPTIRQNGDGFDANTKEHRIFVLVTFAVWYYVGPVVVGRCSVC